MKKGFKQFLIILICATSAYGNGKDDIFRYQAGECGANVFVSNGSEFTEDGCWTPAGANFDSGGWLIGNFDGDFSVSTSKYEFGENISIYPNPVADYFTVEVEENINISLQLKISSSEGIVVYKRDLIRSNTINLSNQPLGIYIVEITDLTLGKRMIEKILKVK